MNIVVERSWKVLRPHTAPLLRWSANHASAPRPVRGGWEAARALVSSINGADWPWTCIDLGFPAPFFQVLGTADQCLLELGAPDMPAHTVYRKNTESIGWVGMPSECAYWVGAIRSEEVFTAGEAFDEGRRWLLGLQPSGEYALRPANPTPHRN